MKQILCRVACIVNVTDSEYKTLKQKYGHEQEMKAEDMEKIMKRGEFYDMYILQDSFDCPELMGLKA